jgi:hypothetical protein
MLQKIQVSESEYSPSPSASEVYMSSKKQVQAEREEIDPIEQFDISQLKTKVDT